MMKMKKIIMPALLCAALLALTGCGKTEEKTADTSAAAQEETTVASSAETEAESQKEKKSATETETDTGTESETSVESGAETQAESASAQNAETTTAVTTAAGTASTTTAAAETQAQQTERTPAQENTPENDNSPDVPAEVVIVTEAPVAQVDAPDPDANTATEPPAEENNNTADELSLTVNYQGYALTVGESIKDFVENVKPAADPERAPSCLGNGEDLVYEYNDFTLYVWNDNDSYTLTGLDVFSPGITSVKGMDIGSAATFDGEKIYDMGNGCNIMVVASGGVVTIISYNKNL